MQAKTAKANTGTLAGYANMVTFAPGEQLYTLPITPVVQIIESVCS